MQPSHASPSSALIDNALTAAAAALRRDGERRSLKKKKSVVFEICRFTHLVDTFQQSCFFLFHSFSLFIISSIYFSSFLVSESHFVSFYQKLLLCAVRLSLYSVGFESNPIEVCKIRSEKFFIYFFLITLSALKMEHRICLHHRLKALQYSCCRENRTPPCWRWEVGVTGMLLLHVVATGATKRLNNSSSLLILRPSPPSPDPASHFQLPPARQQGREVTVSFSGSPLKAISVKTINVYNTVRVVCVTR